MLGLRCDQMGSAVFILCWPLCAAPRRLRHDRCLRWRLGQILGTYRRVRFRSPALGRPRAAPTLNPFVGPNGGGWHTRYPLVWCRSDSSRLSPDAATSARSALGQSLGTSSGRVPVSTLEEPAVQRLHQQVAVIACLSEPDIGPDVGLGSQQQSQTSATATPNIGSLRSMRFKYTDCVSQRRRQHPMSGVELGVRTD